MVGTLEYILCFYIYGLFLYLWYILTSMACFSDLVMLVTRWTVTVIGSLQSSTIQMNLTYFSPVAGMIRSSSGTTDSAGRSGLVYIFGNCGGGNAPMYELKTSREMLMYFRSNATTSEEIWNSHAFHLTLTTVCPQCNFGTIPVQICCLYISWVPQPYTITLRPLHQTYHRDNRTM